MRPRTQPLRPGSTPRPRRAEGVRNHRAVMQAARHLIAEEGADVALHRIAGAAHVSVPTVLRHVGSRAELLGRVFAEELRRLDRGTTAWVTSLADQQLGSRASLHTAVWRIGVLIGGRPTLCALLTGPDSPDRCATLVTTLAPRLVPLVARGHQARTVAPELEAEDLLWLQIALLHIPDAATGVRLHGVIARGLSPEPPHMRG